MGTMRQYAVLGSTTCLLTVAAACGGSASDTSSSPSGRETVRVLELSNQMSNVLIDVGVSEGLFKKHGVDIETVDFPAGLETGQAVKATKTDTIELTFGTAIAGWQAGAATRLQLFCGTEPVIPNQIIALEDSPLPSMEDGATWQEVMKALSKKRLGFPAPEGGGYWKLWVAGMKEAGVKDSDVLTVNVGTSITTIKSMLEKDGLDAALVTAPGPQFLQDAGGFKTLMKLPEGPSVYSDLYGAAFAGPTDFVKKRPEAAKAYCQGIDEAITFVQDPANADVVVAAVEKTGLTRPAAEAAVKENFSTFSTEMAPDRLQLSIDTYLKNGIVEQEPVPTVEDLVDNMLKD